MPSRHTVPTEAMVIMSFSKSRPPMLGRPYSTETFLPFTVAPAVPRFWPGTEYARHTISDTSNIALRVMSIPPYEQDSSIQYLTLNSNHALRTRASWLNPASIRNTLKIVKLEPHPEAGVSGTIGSN